MSAIFDAIAAFLAENILPLFLEHGSFLLAAALLTLGGQFMKRFVFTKERAIKGKPWLWARRTMPFHPVLLAGILDLILWRPYYVGAGFVSIWLYDVVAQWVKNEYRIELDLWKDSLTPDLPSTDDESR